jgi:hypothetical protein
MHYIRIHQHIEKNSVQLKEALTHRCESARRASIDNAATRSRSEAKNPRGIAIRESQYCRKRLHRRHFLYSCCDRPISNRGRREVPASPGRALRGL